MSDVEAFSGLNPLRRNCLRQTSSNTSCTGSCCSLCHEPQLAVWFSATLQHGKHGDQMSNGRGNEIIPGNGELISIDKHLHRDHVKRVQLNSSMIGLFDKTRANLDYGGICKDRFIVDSALAGIAAWYCARVV